MRSGTGKGRTGGAVGRVSPQLVRIAIFVGLTVVTIGFVLYFTVNRDTIKALAHFDIRYVLALVAIWVVAFSMDAVSFIFYTRGTEERLSLKASFKAAAYRIFFNLITPFSVGGNPFVVYYLQKEGVPPGKGSSIVMAKLLMISGWVLAGAAAGFIFFHNHITKVTALNTLFLVSGLTQVAFIVLIVVGLMRPRAMIRIIALVGALLARFKLVKNPARLRRQVIHEAYLAKTSFKSYFQGHFLAFALGTVAIGTMYCVEVLTLWVIFLGLGVDLPFATGVTIGALLLFLLPFLPTPGAAGLGEALFILLFAGLVPYYVLGVAVLLWRFFYNYLTAMTGAIFSSRLVSKMLLKADRPGEHA